MRHLLYLAVLLACLMGTLPLELGLGARVYRRWRRALAAVLPVAAAFVAWDIAAVAAGWWSFDPRYILGIRLPGGLPIEEVLFFVVIPVCAILTLEAVRRLRPDWRLDEPGPNPGPDLGSAAARPAG